MRNYPITSAGPSSVFTLHITLSTISDSNTCRTVTRYTPTIAPSDVSVDNTCRTVVPYTSGGNPCRTVSLYNSGDNPCRTVIPYNSGGNTCEPPRKPRRSASEHWDKIVSTLDERLDATENYVKNSDTKLVFCGETQESINDLRTDVKKLQATFQQVEVDDRRLDKLTTQATSLLDYLDLVEGTLEWDFIVPDTHAAYKGVKNLLIDHMRPKYDKLSESVEVLRANASEIPSNPGELVRVKGSSQTSTGTTLSERPNSEHQIVLRRHANFDRSSIQTPHKTLEGSSYENYDTRHGTVGNALIKTSASDSKGEKNHWNLVTDGGSSSPSSPVASTSTALVVYRGPRETS